MIPASATVGPKYRTLASSAFSRSGAQWRHFSSLPASPPNCLLTASFDARCRHPRANLQPSQPPQHPHPPPRVTQVGAVHVRHLVFVCLAPTALTLGADEVAQ